VKWIEVRDRDWATQYQSDHPWIAISIATHLNTWPILQSQNRIALLQLAFTNDSYQQVQFVSPGIFTYTHAKQILDFVAAHWDEVSSILIHCGPIPCRAAAIAAAIMYIRYGKGADNWYFQKMDPNWMVYHMMLREYYDPAKILL
jgi:predicted protein tyrosine phosphatase